MHVVVDQPGNDGPAPQIDPARVRPGEPRDLLVGADRHDAVAPNRHRLRDRKPLIDGDDFPVRQDQIGRGRLRASMRSRRRAVMQRR